VAVPLLIGGSIDEEDLPVMLSNRSATGRRSVLAAVAALAVSVGTLAGPAHADPVDPGPVAPAAAIDCPAPVPVADITAGMVGEGWTVVRGSTPQPFRVDVLGVLTDGIGAGRDMVMIEISDVSGGHVVDDHGIWAGMSGSPVYVNGKLLGAVSYGFTSSPSPIGGLTPAADMMKLLGVSSTAAAKAEARAAKTKVTLTANERKSLDARAASAVPSTSLERLRTPLSVSGLNAKRRASLQHEFDAAGRSVITYAGSRATNSTAAAARPQAGGNFAAVQTYGDVTLAAIGTTTAVCGNSALAFGHPMDFTGAVSFGANDASSLAIVDDNTFGSFKMANVGGSFGKVEQDRLAGLRARLGAGPKTVPVTTTIRSLDNGAKRTGTTQVAAPDYLALATVYGIWANYATTWDEFGRGLATSSWTITGVRAGGKKFAVSRSNIWSDLGDPTNGPAFEAADAVGALTSNEYEPVTITGVTFNSDVSSAYQQLRITKMAVSVNGGKWTSPKTLRVKAGATIKVRTTTRGYRSATDQVLVQTIKVPKKTGGRTGVLSVEGGLDAASDLGEGSDDAGCLLSECDEPEGSLDTIIKGITSVPRNNVVLADLALDEPDSGSGKAIDVHTSSNKSAPVVGGKSIQVNVRK
jgi:hypothetical protein